MQQKFANILSSNKTDPQTAVNNQKMFQRQASVNSCDHKDRQGPPVLFRQKSVESESELLNDDLKKDIQITKHKNKKSKDDFLKATMRIFLVVSPPISKLQVRSRSLNHLDTLEHIKQRQSITDEEIVLKDSHSEPDCTNKRLDGLQKLLKVPKSKKITSDTSKTLSSITAKEMCTLKRNNFSRSQVSSSEYFTINFENYSQSNNNNTSKSCQQQSDYEKDELLPALKGISLRSSAEDANSLSSTSNDFKSSLLPENEQHKKHGKQRWSSFFNINKQDSRLELLIEQLNNYSKHGIPPIPYLDTNNNLDAFNSFEHFQSDWTEFIDFKNLTEKEQQRQTALWELITTEIAYINVLKVVTDLFLACLQNLQLHNILLEIDINKLFSNIVEILNTNIYFWTTYLYPFVERIQKERKAINVISELYDGFIRIKDIFNPYIQYCTEQTRCQQYCRECQDNSELFTAYLVWCETRKECNRLRLSDILVIPMQRLTKYGLLLKAIYRNTDNDEELPVLNKMIKFVDSFVQGVNLSLKQKQEIDRLQTVISKIESYDALECKDEDLEKLIRLHNTLDLTCPMFGCSIERRRHLLIEGDLKLKDNLNSKIEVHCFLLTDMLIICKNSAKKSTHAMKVIRQPYIVDRLIVTELNRETPSIALIYLNEYNMAISAFMLQSNDSKKLKYWTESIKRAQILYVQAKEASARSLTPGTSEEFNDYYDYSADFNYDIDSCSGTLVPKSPLLSSSRGSKVSSVTHSHSGSFEINETNQPSTRQHPIIDIQQNTSEDSLKINYPQTSKKRLFNTGKKSPSNTLTVHSTIDFVQSLPNLANVNTCRQNTLTVPNAKTSPLLSPNQRGTSYPPPSPPRSCLKRSFAFVQNPNPPLLKTKNVNSFTSPNIPHSVQITDYIERQKSLEDHVQSSDIELQPHRRHKPFENRRYHTAGTVDDIKKKAAIERDKDKIPKRSSWNFE